MADDDPLPCVLSSSLGHVKGGQSRREALLTVEEAHSTPSSSYLHFNSTQPGCECTRESASLALETSLVAPRSCRSAPRQRDEYGTDAGAGEAISRALKLHFHLSLNNVYFQGIIVHTDVLEEEEVS